jgi:hypothetical protein
MAAAMGGDDCILARQRKAWWEWEKPALIFTLTPTMIFVPACDCGFSRAYNSGFSHLLVFAVLYYSPDAPSPLIIAPPPLIPPTPLPHRRRPNRTTTTALLLRHYRIRIRRPERVPKVLSCGLCRRCSGGIALSRGAPASIIDEAVQLLGGALGAGLDGVAYGGGGQAGLGCEVGFCELVGGGC